MNNKANTKKEEALDENAENVDFLRDYFRVDIAQFTASFGAIKKFLGEKGPFKISERKSFTVSEKLHYDANTPQDVRRVNHAHLVLGFGLHSVVYKSQKVWIWYRQVGEPVSELGGGYGRFEKLTLYVQPYSVQERYPDEVSKNDNTLNDQASLPPWLLLKSFVNDALEFEQTEDQEETKIFTINERLFVWTLSTERPKRPMDSVFIKRDIKNDIINDLEKFFKSRDFYASHGIAFKRGYLLYGPPGCGKSSLVSAMAGKFNLNICLLQIGHKSLTDNVLHSLFMNAPSRSIILVEDIDTLFVDRTNANANQSVTFSGFINALDGVGSAEGKVIIVTTNHESKLDEALLRPGRIDKQYKVDYADKEEMEDMFLYYYPGKKKKALLFKDSVAGNWVTTAEIQQHFIKYQDNADFACKNRGELIDDAQNKVTKKIQKESNGGLTSSFISLW